jgi:hypothetical protein
VVTSEHGGTGTGRSGPGPEGRLKAVRERRLRLDPDQLAREQRIDETAVGVELAWETRAEAERAVGPPRSRPRPRWSGS